MSAEFSAQVRAFMDIAKISAASIGNLKTDVASVGPADRCVPVSVNTSELGNTWVCSPHAAYARYSLEELKRLNRPLMSKSIEYVCRGLGGYLWKAGLDDCVAINNWLLSTNLYPRLDSGMVREWVVEALDKWPSHALWFRSLNARYDTLWLRELEEAGFTLIPSRQVYLYDKIVAGSGSPQNLRRDLRLLRTTALLESAANRWSSVDFVRAAELYAELYLQKYSALNPAYSDQFLRAWVGAGLLDLTGYRDASGTLQAVVGLFAVGETITAPIVGYATHLPQRLGLYRLLMATVFERARRSGRRINLSAGASTFKRLRGGMATVEYSAVYVRHLPRSRRRAIGLLALLAKGVGEPLMRRLQL